MLRIISDTSTMYSTKQAREAGFAVAPLTVTVADKTYRELDEIDSKTFVELVRQGNVPRSSQPAIGEVMELMEENPDDEVIAIAMAKGLSGTYESAVSAAATCKNRNHITVINSRTLCGPHRYMVEKANEMAKAGKSKEEVLEWLNHRIDGVKSYLMPNDFDFLRRGGRLSPLVSHVGKTVKLVPIMTQSDDGCKLVAAGIKRNFKQAVVLIRETLKRRGVGKGWKIYISHADAENLAKQAEDILKEEIGDASYETMPLTPAFITQGGPGCVAVQIIEE